ncbi:MAG: hypothetical protein HQL29_01425 [Candidatus Omnitrophica bacterium]|nr:hypothetical protein [Candidatus Omnitrophota bacterium]
MKFNLYNNNFVESVDMSKIFWHVFIVGVIFMAIGIYLGNPFETYQNASTL